MKSRGWIYFTVLCVMVVGSLGVGYPNNHLATATPLAEDVLYVKPESYGAEDCSSWDDACGLQDALDTALYGDQIWVAAGIYTPTQQTDPTDERSATFEMQSGVGIYGGFAGGETDFAQRDWGSNINVLSGDLDGNDLTDPTGVITDTTNVNGSNAYHVVSSEGVTETAILDGFSIAGGVADGDYSYEPCVDRCGGGMYNVSSSPVLSNVTFSSNSASGSGGGMYNFYSSPVLSIVTFSGNTTGSGGGGMFNWYSSPALTNVHFSGNTAGSVGGGMHTQYSSTLLSNVTFSGNTAGDQGSGNVTGSDGGGMSNVSSSPNLTNVTFSGNKAGGAFGRGGGMFNGWNSHPALTNVNFSGNTAGSDGGGMLNWHNSPVLTNVSFSGNNAGYGGGMYNWFSSPIITSTILWGNTAEDSGYQIFNGSSDSTISYSDIQGGCEAIPGNDCSGGGNIDADPLFVRDPDPGADDIWGTEDDDYGDLRLGPLSPAIDAGDNTAVPDGVTTDLEGNPRFADIPGVPDAGHGPAPIVDMGAFEAVNIAPTAMDDPQYKTDNLTPLLVDAPGVLENDADSNLDPLQAILVDSPSSGSLALNPSGSFSYTPTVDFTGVVTFTYRASDNLLASLPATVTITVQRTIYLPLITH